MAIRHRLGTLAARAALAILFLAPICVFVLHAFSVRWFYPQVIPEEWTLAPFLKQINQSRTQEALLESVQIALLVSGLSVLIAYPAARTLGLEPIRGKGLLTMLMFFPTVVPPVATGMGLNILFLKIGLAGTVTGVVLVHLIPILPYTVFALTGVFARYDPNYEYQARVLGAGQVRVFLTITLPLVLPGVVVAALFAFLISWSEYLLTFLIGGGRVITMPVLLFSSVSGGNPTTMSALALLFVAPPIVVIVATARYLMRYGVPGQTDHG